MWIQRLVFLASVLPKNIPVCSFLPILFPAIVPCFGLFSICSLSVGVSQFSVLYSKSISHEMKIIASMTKHCALGASRMKLSETWPSLRPSPPPWTLHLWSKREWCISDYLQVSGTFQMLYNTDSLDKWMSACVVEHVGAVAIQIRCDEVGWRSQGAFP